VTLSDVSIRRPVLAWMMSLALLVFGTLGYARLGVDQYPDMEFPTVTVTAMLEGASPQGMEEDVTDVLEEHLNSISGVRSLQSTSNQGVCRVTVEFELGTDLDVAVQDVRDQVAASRPFLPREVEPPTVSKRTASGFPVVYVPFSSDTRPLVEVSEYVRRHVKPVLETIPGVAGVALWGRRDRNIRIWLDADALGARGLAVSDVLTALARQHVDLPGGVVEGHRLEWSVKTDAEFRTLAELEDMVVAQRGDAPIHLRDVARIEDGVEDVREFVRYNGVPPVAAGVVKQSGANTVSVVDEVYRRVAELRPLLPDGIRMPDQEQFVDFSLSIRESVRETQFALVLGGLLAVFVVFVFLRRTRPTLIVAAAIPLSLITTFGLIWAFGYTLNTMTLLGMTLAIGVVIDDAIIVLENIERHREMGKEARHAASEGTRQIVFAATAATLSVAAVFLPVVFAEGIVGNFLGEFGLTVAGSVLISLFVALTLTPMLAARIPPAAPRAHGSVYQRLESAFLRLEKDYRRLLDWSLRRRLVTFGIAVLSFALAVFFGARLPAEFFPKADGRVIYAQFETPPGSTIEATTEVLEQNERYFLGQPEVLSSFEGVGTTNVTHVGTPSRGAMFMTLVPSHQRKRSSQEIMREARAVLGAIPGQKININDPTGSFSSSGEFQVEIRGNLAISDLDRYASLLIDSLAHRGGFVDLNKNLEMGLPEVRVVPDRRKAAALGVDAATVAQVVQVMIGGLDVGVFKEAGSRYDIRMRLERDDRDRPAAIHDLSVRAADGRIVDLRNLVAIETGAAASAIARSDRQRSVTITANLQGKALGDAMRDLDRAAAEILPEGVTARLSGQAEAMQESGRQFVQLLMLAVLVIYMVLAAQFESFVLPLSVMLALPFSMVGALGALYAAGMTLNLFSTIGILLLLGLVTKNSILLVDYANQLREEGRPHLEAMREAAPVRMRPVLMTAFSMIFGVLPAALGLGPGAETRAPMAVATAAGMLSSMLLTLLVVPVFYVALNDFAAWARRLPGRLRRAPAWARSRAAGGS
jgi:HAE1 family hydrophobic/amphiphilic exporter-1